MISGMYSLGTLIAGLSMGLMGGLIDRRGHRLMTTAIAIAFINISLSVIALVNTPEKSYQVSYPLVEVLYHLGEPPVPVEFPLNIIFF